MHKRTVTELVALLRTGGWSPKRTDLLKNPRWNPTALDITLEVLCLAGVIRRDGPDDASERRYQWI
jgi:hypothetical protein